MNKLAPYIVSFIAFLLCAGIFVFGGFKWEDRGFGWGYIYFGCSMLWGFITCMAFDILGKL